MAAPFQFACDVLVLQNMAAIQASDDKFDTKFDGCMSCPAGIECLGLCGNGYYNR